MSQISDILLLTAANEHGIIEAQRWLRANYWPELVEIANQAGGNKGMKSDVWASAINYFAIEAFVSAMKEIKWERPESMQLLVKDEHDDCFMLRVGFGNG
jgi:hypothetical protein